MPGAERGRGCRMSPRPGGRSAPGRPSPSGGRGRGPAGNGGCPGPAGLDPARSRRVPRPPLWHRRSWRRPRRPGPSSSRSAGPVAGERGLPLPAPATDRVVRGALGRLSPCPLPKAGGVCDPGLVQGLAPSRRSLQPGVTAGTGPRPSSRGAGSALPLAAPSFGGGPALRRLPEPVLGMFQTACFWWAIYST